MIWPGTRTDHKIHNEIHLNSFINKEEELGLSESNVVREDESGLVTF